MTGAPGGPAKPGSADLAQRFRAHARQCAQADSRLMSALLEGAADDVDAGGPAAELLDPLRADPPGSLPALRFAGALHRLVLSRRAPLLAVHYPSVGGTAPVEQVWPAARAVIARQPDELRPLLKAPVQTNEVGRVAALQGALQRLAARDGLPVRLLEVGASAGLNLRPELVRLVVAGRPRGPQSPVVLIEPWRGPAPPDVPVRILERAGCDPAPLDPATPHGRLTLTSYVWADQRERLERLRGALELAARLRVPVQPLPASAFLACALQQAQRGVHTVVWHSVVMQYLLPAERELVEEQLAEAGARATPDAPLTRLSLEPDVVGDQRFRFEVRAQTWPHGGVTVLAEASGHGPPITWR